MAHVWLSLIGLRKSIEICWFNDVLSRTFNRGAKHALFNFCGHKGVNKLH
jgi:hypothetical protein